LMYERRLEHSLYKTLAELQRLRLLRQIDPPTEETTAPPPPNRAKQTQSAPDRNPPKTLSCPRLRPNGPSGPAKEQTQTNPISPALARLSALPPRESRCQTPGQTVQWPDHLHDANNRPRPRKAEADTKTIRICREDR
jgi:hypothetical protein